MLSVLVISLITYPIATPIITGSKGAKLPVNSQIIMIAVNGALIIVVKNTAMQIMVIKSR